MEFEWDENKAKKNLAKHGVTFREAESVFGDSLAMTYEDPDHSDHSIGEKRWLTFGATITGRLVVVSHAERGGSMRIISARMMQNRERRIYEEA